MPDPGAGRSGRPARSHYRRQPGMEKRVSLDEAYNKDMTRYRDNGFNDLTHLLVAIWGLEAGVNNGGFHQYWFNSYGDFARLASPILREIGVSNMAQIVDEANAEFGPGGPPDDRAASVFDLAKKILIAHAVVV